MRIIKFRAWAGGVMVYFGLFDTASNWQGITLIKPPQYSVSKDNKNIMQFTEHKDKNKKDIYDGDIVEYTYKSPKYTKTGIGEVYWDKGSWMIDMKDDIEALFNFEPKRLKILGNIYENKKLLKP